MLSRERLLGDRRRPLVPPPGQRQAAHRGNAELQSANAEPQQLHFGIRKSTIEIRMSEELKKRTKKFALDVIGLCAGFPQVLETRHAIGQVIRSSSSVAANYRSACRGKSKADFISKLGTVEEEADESGFWLEMHPRYWRTSTIENRRSNFPRTGAPARRSESTRRHHRGVPKNRKGKRTMNDELQMMNGTPVKTRTWLFALAPIRHSKFSIRHLPAWVQHFIHHLAA